MPSSDTNLRLRLGAAALAIAVAAAAILFYSQPAAPVAPPMPALAPTTSQHITVHVSGAVVSAGLVEVPWSARVADVVAAAGGTTPLADLTALNLASPVRDGEQIVVPELGSSAAAGPGETVVRLNSASLDQLESIPGIGPVLAGRILEARDERGGFSSVEDLLDVSGIGEAKLASFRDLVSVP